MRSPLKNIPELHGIEMKCPTCGAPGTLDTMTPSGDVMHETVRPIWHNPNEGCGWECYECWLK